MLNERLAILISRHLSGEATIKEKKELQQYLLNHPSDQYFLELLTSYWNSTHESENQVDIHADEHFQHILQLAGQGADSVKEVELFEAHQKLYHRRINIRRWSVAATIAGIAIISWKFLSQPLTHNEQDKRSSEIVANKGIRSKMILPDGSKVWLNADSKLVFIKSFNDTLREVELYGEAYFDVVKDAKRPFIVHTAGDLDIRVLGTAFNVKSYADEPTIETTLIHGLIEVVVKNKSGSPKVILRPHEKLVYNKTTSIQNDAVNKPDKKTAERNTPELQNISIKPLSAKIPDSLLTETSWVYNKLIFDGDTFHELAIKMERWYNVKIIFKNDKVANYRLKGVFINESIEEALQALQLIAPFRFNISGNEIVISKK